MKLTAAIFLHVFAGIYSLRQSEVGLDGVQVGIIAKNTIQKAVNIFNQNVVERGYDPLVIANDTTRLYLPILVWADEHLEGLKCTGIAQNRFNRLSFNTVTMRLNFELEWPRITCELKSKMVGTAFIWYEIDSSKSGSLELTNSSIVGSVHAYATSREKPSCGIIFTDCLLQLNLNLQSNLKVTWQKQDVSDEINAMVEAINEVIQANKEEIGAILCGVLEDNLSSD